MQCTQFSWTSSSAIYRFRYIWRGRQDCGHFVGMWAECCSNVPGLSISAFLHVSDCKFEEFSGAFLYSTLPQPSAIHYSTHCGYFTLVISESNHQGMLSPRSVHMGSSVCIYTYVHVNVHSKRSLVIMWAQWNAIVFHHCTTGLEAVAIAIDARLFDGQQSWQDGKKTAEVISLKDGNWPL